MIGRRCQSLQYRYSPEMHALLVLSLCFAALSGSRAQNTQVSFEVFSAPKADCITSPPVVTASFSSAFPTGTRLPKFFYTYAGSMPGAAAREACLQMGPTQGTVVLLPTFENEGQGVLRVRLGRNPSSHSLQCRQEGRWKPPQSSSTVQTLARLSEAAVQAPLDLPPTAMAHHPPPGMMVHEGAPGPLTGPELPPHPPCMCRC